MIEAKDKPDDDTTTCFVIGPIGSGMAPIGSAPRITYENSLRMWEEVFEPACAQVGLRPIRADKIVQPGEINEQIFILLRDAEIVIADLTGGNPNVMYELGLRHTRDKVTIQVGEYERLPFDVNTIRTIQFRPTEAGRIEVRDRLIEALKAGLAGGAMPVTATRVWRAGSSLSSEVLALATARSAAPDDEESEAAEPGFLDVLAEGETSLEAAGGVLNDVVGWINALGDIAKTAGGRIASSDQSGKGFAGRLRIARELAEQFSEPGSELEKLAEEFEQDVKATDTMVLFVMNRALEDEEERASSSEFLTSVGSLSTSAMDAVGGMTELAQSARQMRQISRELHAPSKTIEAAVNRIVGTTNTIIGWSPLLVEAGLIDASDVGGPGEGAI